MTLLLLGTRTTTTRTPTKKINYIGINLTCHGKQNGIRPHPKWKTTSPKMEDDLTQNGIRPHPKWKMTKMEDEQNGRQAKWKTTKMEDDKKLRRPKIKETKK